MLADGAIIHFLSTHVLLLPTRKPNLLAALQRTNQVRNTLEQMGREKINIRSAVASPRIIAICYLTLRCDFDRNERKDTLVLKNPTQGRIGGGIVLLSYILKRGLKYRSLYGGQGVGRPHLIFNIAIVHDNVVSTTIIQWICVKPIELNIVVMDRISPYRKPIYSGVLHYIVSICEIC